MNDLQMARIRRANIQNAVVIMIDFFSNLEISSGEQNVCPINQATQLIEELKLNNRFNEYGELIRA